MRHFDELELLDAYYVPSAATEQTAHLSGCAECQGRFERLRQRLNHDAAALREQVDALPETFWTRQRLGISRETSGLKRDQGNAARRFALAASLVVVLSGGMFFRPGGRQVQPAATRPVAAVSAPAAAPVVDVVDDSADPWDSEQISGFHDVVQWESWSSEDSKGGS